MAGGIGGGDPDQPMADINVTPLVDVMLVLLVIFIVAAPLMAQALRVDLPKAAAPASTDPQVKDLVVTVGGDILFDDQLLTREQLGQALKTMKPETVLRLNGDGAVPYEAVAQVLSLARQNGVTRIAFATSKPSR